jgi:uncharacterized protein
MMQSIARSVASKWPPTVAAMRDKAANEAGELCGSGHCAAAVVALQLAVDLGHLPSRARLAWMFLWGREGIAEDYNRAFELAEEQTRLGCHHCQGVVALCCWWGWRCDVDMARSLQLARKSSGRGSRYGQYTLGFWYHMGGEELSHDPAQSLALYRLAADQGLDVAQVSLGSLYYLGRGVAQDLDAALRLFLLAAAQGHPAAFNSVAQCHEHGQGECHRLVHTRTGSGLD